jgi:flavorubredoxin
MVTYIPEDKLLLPNDAFGQHIASSGRFDDEVPWDILREEACKYYNNIVMPYGDQVKGALDALGGLDIDMIGPSHGIIWRSIIPKILEEYTKWATYQTEKRALIVYDSMWGSTEKMAHCLAEGLTEAGIPVSMRNLRVNHMSDVVTDLADSKLVLIGSPTLNNGMMPSVGGFLTYIKGLRPRGRIGFAFGSYGWSGEASKDITKYMEDMKWEVPEDLMKIQWIPDNEELGTVKEMGKKLGELL